MKKLFNSLFGKEDRSSLEERYVPAPLKAQATAQESDETAWICGQLFIVENPKEFSPPANRIYMGAIKNAGGLWTVQIHRYFVEGEKICDDINLYRDTVGGRRCVEIITKFDSSLCSKKEKFTPIDGMAGNARRIANFFGLYVDDRGDLQDLEKGNGLINRNALMMRSGLAKLFPQPKTTASDIASWDDFYAHVARRNMLSQPEMLALFARCPNVFDELVEETRKLDDLKKTIADSSATYVIRMNAIASLARASKPRDFDGDGRLSYQRQLVAFATLLRAGAALRKVYAETFSQFSVLAARKNAITLMDKVIKAAEETAVSSFGISMEKAQKIKQFILTDDTRPTPIEAVIAAWATEGARYKELLELSKPKPPAVTPS